MAFVKLIDLPGGQTKFTLRRYDATSGAGGGGFLALTNPVVDAACPSQRNVLALAAAAAANSSGGTATAGEPGPSTLLGPWRVVATLAQDDTGFAPQDSARYTAFSYVDWVFDGDDILYAARTGYRGAFSYHNTNRITFGRVVGWRSSVQNVCN